MLCVCAKFKVGDAVYKYYKNTVQVSNDSERNANHNLTTSHIHLALIMFVEHHGLVNLPACFTSTIVQLSLLFDQDLDLLAFPHLDQE